MRETPRARQAWADYLAMGPARSLRALANLYIKTVPRYGNSTADVVVRILERWSTAHQWQARLAAIAEQEQLAIIAEGIANRQNRVNALNERWDLLRQVIKERSAEVSIRPVPGGKTGLLVRQTKGIGAGDNFQVVDEYSVDVALLKELREHERQAAQELGQWVEKSDAKVSAEVMVQWVPWAPGDAEEKDT